MLESKEWKECWEMLSARHSMAPTLVSSRWLSMVICTRSRQPKFQHRGRK